MAIQKTQAAVLTAKDFFANQTQRERLGKEIARLMTAGCALDPARFLLIAERVVKKNPKLLSCTAMSVATSIVEAAVFGLELDPLLGQCYMVPFKDNKSGTVVCQFMLGYKGYIALANRSNLHIDAHLVFAKDSFSIDHGADRPISHKPYVPKKRGEDRGDLLGAYALITFADGHQVAEWMPFEDLEKRRMRSRASNDGPWVTDTMAMYRKTVVRAAGSSRIPLDVGRNLVRAATLEDQREVSLPVDLPEASAAAEAVLDVTDAIEVTEDPEEPASNQAGSAPESTQASDGQPLMGTEYVDPKQSECEECHSSFGVHMKTCSKFVNPHPQDGKDDDLLERTGTITDIKAPRGKGPGYIVIDGVDFGTFNKTLIVEWSGRKGAKVYLNYRRVTKGDKVYQNLVAIERIDQ